jgi:hypothetical protein
MKQSRYAYAKRAPVPARTGPDDFVYDSRTEMLRGLDLQLLQRGGVIRNLERQVKFPLEYRCSCGGITVMAGNRPAHYTADFVYEEKTMIKEPEGGVTGPVWVRVVEDVKGYADETSKLRVRVFEAVTGQKVTIMKKIRGVGWVKE